eukprot:scaffold14.g1076.t1
MDREAGGSRHCTPAASREASGKRALEQWQEADFLRHSSAHYATFSPAPRSTIALSYNSDGTLLASTHGDHTVKLMCCQTNTLVRTLSGHRRTPWVVRFHPRKPNLLASGSLDHEVRLWDADTGQCIARHTFGKPIASLAFHVSADVLAIACGHKLYVWEYSTVGRSPTIVLKTRRSMRAVHFHPHGLPIVLTAEVQDPSPTPELPATLTEGGPYVAPHGGAAVEGAGPAARGAGGVGPAAGAGGAPGGGGPFLAAQRQQPSQHQADTSAHDRPAAMTVQRALGLSSPLDQLRLAGTPLLGTPTPEWAGSQPAAQQQQRAAPRPPVPGWVPPGSPALPSSMVPTGWELPFPTSLFAGGPAGAAGAGAHGAGEANWAAAAAASLPHVMAAFSAAAWNIIGEEQPPRVRLKLWRFDPAKPTAPLEIGGNLRMQISDAVLCSEMGVQFSPCGRYLAATTAARGPLPASVGAPMGADVLPPHEMPEGGGASPPALPGPATLRLSAALRAGGLPGALQRLAGAGRQPSPMDISPPERLSSAASGVAELAGGQGGGGLRPERVVFEVRQIAIGGGAAGRALRAKRIRAAHCLTSVQFSPAGDHMLLAYGKKHMSLLRSLQADRGSVVPLHTILEVVRLEDMQLVRVLPSAEDEINAACFHPRAGGGLAYGTKEGRLRVVNHDRSSLDGESGRAKRAVSSSARLSSVEEEAHPTERELEGLQAWVVTQQLLQSEAGAGGGARDGGAAGGPPMQQQLQALQELWQGARGGGGGTHPPRQ